MPIFRVDNELHFFAHVPKCAGTTIEAHLVDRFGPLGLFGTDTEFHVSLQHLTWAEVISLVPENWIASSFAVVRHPLARFLSAYNMRLSQIRPPFPRETTITDFLDWVELRLPAHPELLDNHLRSQVEFIATSTRVFRLEDGIDAVIAHLDESFGPALDLAPLAHHDFRVPETEHLFDVTYDLPERVVKRVARLYAADLAHLGYDTEPARPVKVKVLKPEYAHPFKRHAWRIRQSLGHAIMRRGAIGNV